MLKKYAKIACKKEILLGSSFFLLGKKREKREERFFSFSWFTLLCFGEVASQGKMGFEPTQSRPPGSCSRMGGRLKQTNAHIAG